MELIPRREAAPYVGKSVPWLKLRAKNNQPPRFYRIGREIFYDRQDLDTFLRSCAVEPAVNR